MTDKGPERGVEHATGSQGEDRAGKPWAKPELVSLSITGTRSALLCKHNESQTYYLGSPPDCVGPPPPP